MYTKVIVLCLAVLLSIVIGTRAQALGKWDIEETELFDDEDPFKLILPVMALSIFGLTSESLDGDIKAGFFSPKESGLNTGYTIGGQVGGRFKGKFRFDFEYDVYRADWKDSKYPTIDVATVTINGSFYVYKHIYLGGGIGVFFSAEEEGDMALGVGPAFQLKVGAETKRVGNSGSALYIELEYRIMPQSGYDADYMPAVYKDIDFGGIFCFGGIRF